MLLPDCTEADKSLKKKKEEKTVGKEIENHSHVALWVADPNMIRSG